MAKKFNYTFGVAILFDRVVTCEVKAPKSGRVVKIEDDAPAILVVSHGDSTSYFVADDGAWKPVNEDEIGMVIDELANADEAKRAPKF